MDRLRVLIFARACPLDREEQADKQAIPACREQVPGALGIRLMTREHRTGYA